MQAITFTPLMRVERLHETMGLNPLGAPIKPHLIIKTIMQVPLNVNKMNKISNT